jgi:hypothetical protein
MPDREIVMLSCIFAVRCGTPKSYWVRDSLPLLPIQQNQSLTLGCKEGVNSTI